MLLSVAVAFGAVAPKRAAAAPESFADLAEKVSPAVVNITTTTTVAAPIDGSPVFPDGSPFGDLFKDFNGQNGQGAPRQSNALGSGFVVSADGYIVTNNHVIEDADQIEIEFFSGERRAATLVGTDPKTDIAVLKVVTEESLPFVEFGDSDVMRVGDWVLAVGNPLGQGFSASAGIVSARNRELSGTYDDYLQTDAAINRGNSGGPLFNLDGQVIGVNTAILSPNGGSIGIGFSMASNVVSKVVAQLQEFGTTRRGWLGVKIQDITADMAEAMALSNTRGAMVTDVPTGPSLDAGIKAGDIITSFDGGVVSNSRDLVRRVADAPVGEAVEVVLLRNGDEVKLMVTLGQRELAEGEGAEAPQPVAGSLLGMTLEPVTPQTANTLGLPEGTQGLVITEVKTDSEAWQRGLRAGDVITEAGQQPVASMSDLNARMEEATAAGRKSVLLLIRRDGEPRFVALPTP
ncbi:Do family serine endopeptidase [Phaeovulum sp.]|uniref:Do family serine endopeptidase n=1 Tax=Phaeovulum sp. TaxID=2934796 RepID=UPI003563DF1B